MRNLIFKFSAVTGAVLVLSLSVSAQTGLDELPPDNPPVASNPTSTVTEPANGAVFTTAALTVRGKASASTSQPKDISFVKVKVIDGLGRVVTVNAAISNAPCGKTSVCDWSANVNLKPGRNTIRAEATDGIGRQGTSSTVAVTYNAPNQTPLSTPVEPPLPGDGEPPPPGGVPRDTDVPGAPPSGGTSGVDSDIDDVSGLPTGPGITMSQYILIALGVACLYLQYTRTAFSRRREAEHLVKESLKEHENFKDK